MMNQAWEEAFHELWTHAAHHRGVREHVTDIPDHGLPHRLRRWPRTCGADVLAIASIVDAVLRAAPLTSGAYGIERRWRHCARELAGTALAEPGLEYRHNREFWSAVSSVIAYLSSVDAEVPDSMWRALLAEVSATPPPHRNAPVVDENLHLTALTYDALWQAQKATLAKLRGADARDPGPHVMGGRMTIPRTTKADVLQLATYWTSALAKVESKRFQMGAHDPDGPDVLHQAGLPGEILRWRRTLADVDTYATTGDRAAVYPENEAFWRASASVAITVAVIDEFPPSFEMQLDATVQRTPEPRNLYRNASYPGEGTFETKWDDVHKDASELRGFDTREALAGRVGRPMAIPRTLNGEISKLAAYWNGAWEKLEAHRGSFPTEIGLDTLKKRWQAVMKDVREIADAGKIEDVYTKNHEFWRESFELAQSLDLFHELPSKLEIAWAVTQTLPDRFADVVGKLAHAVGDIAHKAGEGVTSGLGKPILIAGSVVLGGILLWHWIRPSTSAVPALAAVL